MDNKIIRIAKLKGMENWSIWKFQVRITLISNCTWDVVNGTLKLPEQTAGTNADTLKEINTWKKNDSVAQRIIATSIEEQPLLHIINCETSKAMWNKLTSVYEQKSEANVHMLLQQWYSVTKNSSDDIATHVSQLEDLAHRLQLLGEKIPESMIITKVLMTLPSSYKHFVSAWDSVQTQDRTLANLISRLTIEETRIDGHDKNENKAFAARKQFSKDNSKKSEKSGTCHYCHKPEHWIRDCRKRKSANAKRELGSDKGEALVGEVLTAALRTQKGKDEWYMDSGATDHMSNNRSWFNTYNEFQEALPVRIGDGKRIFAKGSGDINILAFDEVEWKKKHLSNVLYVPELKYNLFSLGAALDKGMTHRSNNSL